MPGLATGVSCALAAADLTERGLHAAAVACSYSIAPEPQAQLEAKPRPELEPSDVLRLKKLQQLAVSDPQRARRCAARRRATSPV